MEITKRLSGTSLKIDLDGRLDTTTAPELEKELIETEDKTQPMTDEVLAERLKQEGYSISRRTVVKYREMLGIPMARHRKKL